MAVKLVKRSPFIDQKWRRAAIRQLSDRRKQNMTEKRVKRSPFVQKWLEQVAQIGLYGTTADDVVEHFVLEGLRRELKQGSTTRTVQDARDSAEFGLLCQKYAR